MNNIVIFSCCLLCLLIVPGLAIANEQQEDHLSNICRDFRAVLDKKTSTEAQTQHIRFKKGLLWEIKNPEGKTNYLFGTMHSQDIAVSDIPPQVNRALSKSKTLFMETIPNAAANQAFLNMMYFKDKQRLDTLLEPELLEELSFIIQNYGVAKEHTNFVKPWAAFSLIGRPIPTSEPTLESNLFQVAQENMLQIKSLETMEEILSALENLSLDDQIIILKDTICNHEQIIRDTKILVDLYVARDLEGIINYNNQPHYDEAVFQRFIQNILYDRNIRMLDRIKNDFKTGDVFVAVGASHLAGEKGLLSELVNSGYKVSAIY